MLLDPRKSRAPPNAYSPARQAVGQHGGQAARAVKCYPEVGKWSNDVTQ